MQTAINYNNLSERLTKLKTGRVSKPVTVASKKTAANGKWVLSGKFFTVINMQEDEDAAVRTDVWN